MRVVSWVLMSPILNRFQHLFVVGLHLVLYSNLDGVNLAPHSLKQRCRCRKHNHNSPTEVTGACPKTVHDPMPSCSAGKSIPLQGALTMEV